MDIKAYEKLTPICRVKISNKLIKFYTPNSFVLWRAQTILTKEPSTAAWIAGMKSGEVLLDIGANVGGYSLLAAITRNVKVYSIEPESQNFNILCTNIKLNELSGVVNPYPIGITDKDGIDYLYISDLRAGGSCHSVGEDLGFDLKKKKSVQFKQGIYSTTVDEFVSNVIGDIPDYIKIDVDGLEHKIISGAHTTLSSPKLKSLSIEINTNLEEHQWIITTLEKYGFKAEQDQIEKALRKDGLFAGVGEFIFTRTS